MSEIHDHEMITAAEDDEMIQLSEDKAWESLPVRLLNCL